MNIELSKWQSEFMRKFEDDLLIAVCGISSGKSRILSIWCVMQCLQKPGTRGVLIAQNYKALSRVLIHELETVCALMNIHYTYNKSSMEFKFDNESILFCYSAENPQSILGLSEINILCIDEAAYITEEIYHLARDRMRGSKYKSQVRLISSPQNTRMSNWFSNLVKKYPESVIHATALDNPFTSEDFKRELTERYGLNTPIYRQQVLGEILDGDVIDQIVRRDDFCDIKQYNDERYYLGVDFAGLGCDNTVITVIDKYGVVERVEYNKGNTFELTDMIKKLFGKYNIVNAAGDNTGGYGTGVFDLLSKSNIEINRVNFSGKSSDTQYNNIRTEMYMNAAKSIKSGMYVDDIIREEMIAQSHNIDSHGRVALLPKADIKKNLGHSPDSSDSFVLAVHAMNNNVETVNKQYTETAERYMKFWRSYNYG